MDVYNKKAMKWLQIVDIKVGNGSLEKVESQPCHAGQDRLASIQQALTASRMTDSFADVTLSDVEEAAPESSLIELSDDDIEVV